MAKRLPFLAGLLAVVSASCTQNTRVPDLEKTVTELTAKIESLQTDMESLKSDQRVEEMFADFGKVAYLTPGADGYSVIESDIVKLTVNIDNIQPYANGSRVTLKFGNISSATINDLKGTIEWGRIDEKGSPQNSEAKSRKIIFNKSLRAGSWTNIQLVLEGLPPAELGFVRVRDLSHKGISLLQ